MQFPVFFKPYILLFLPTSMSNMYNNYDVLLLKVVSALQSVML